MNRTNIAFRALLLSTLLMAFLLPQNGWASIEKREFTQTVKKEIGINPNGTARVTNKYGKVDFLTWDKDRVRMEVTIVVDANSESDAQEVFDRISIDFSESGDELSAITQIESSSSWWSWTTKNADYQINYTVMIPRSLSIVVDNKYGNVFAEAIGGRADLIVKYGDFQLNGVERQTSIDLGYGNGNIITAGNLSADIKYSNFTVKNVEDLKIESKYSKVIIENANYITSNSKYDNYTIGAVKRLRNDGKYDDLSVNTASEFVCNTKYSNIKVERVKDRLDLNMEYGGAKIEEVEAGFTEVRVFGRYADFKLGMNNRAGYTLEASANYAGISYPETLKVTHEKENGSEHTVEGHTLEGNKGMVVARLDYGGLRIR